MSRPSDIHWQAHPVLHPPVEAPPNDRGVVWIDEMPQSTWLDSGLIATVSVVTLGSAFLLLSPILAMPAMGATRSARLRWATRQAEIEQALAEQQALEQSNRENGADGQPADVDRHE